MNQSMTNRKQRGLIGFYKVLLLLLTLLPLQAFAQSKASGTVVDEANGEPIIGATVKVKGSSSGVVTDIDGHFNIDVKPGQTLEISYIGYTTQSVKIPRNGNVDVRLSEDTQTLEQVVVVGYGTMKRSDLTGAVSSINEAQIKQGVNTSVEQAMQGRIAGVQVTQNSGAPGGGISVQIRGINSLNGNEPLYVVDGIAMSGQTSDNTSVMSSLNPSDITSIEVLKDASATAIYGSRASNGVVLITTKRGEEGKTKITYEGYAGWQQLPKTLDVMNLPEYADFYNVRAGIMGWGEREDYKDATLLTKGTDWQDVLYQTAFMHNHQVGVNGGTKSNSFALSGGFLDQEGIGIGSAFNRASFRANFDSEINSWLKVGMSGYYARTAQSITFDESNVIQTALNQFPDVAPKNPDGTYGFVQTNDFATYYSNPLFEAQMKENKRLNTQVDYNFYANITPIKGLVIRLEYGGSRGFGDTQYFTPEFQYGSVRNESQMTKGSNRSKYNSFKQYVTYDFDPFKNNHVQIMAGHEAQWGVWGQFSASRKGYITGALHALDLGDSSTATNSGDPGTPWSIESYYGRLNYNLLDRYMVTATLRTDGSSSFGKNNRWGWFPSAAVAWRVKNESFLRDVSWISNLKLRLGWGHVGNQSSGSYAYGAVMATTATAWGTGYYPGNFPNPDLKWESTTAWNVGLDFSFFNNRIEFIVDAYLKKTDNLLMQSSLPSYVINNDWMGMTAPWENTGAIENKGIEFTLNTVNISSNDWKWRTGITLSFNKNKLTGLNSTNSAISGNIGTDTYTLSEIGGPVGRFYGYKVIGMFTKEGDFYQKNQLGEFIIDQNGNRVPVARPANDINSDMHPIAQNSVWVGDFIFEDVNGDGKITNEDRQYIGDPNPDFTFGINNTISWKDFDLSFFFNGSVGNDIYNLVRQNHSDPLGWGNKMKDVTNYARVALIDENGSPNDISNVLVTNPTTATVQRISAAGSSMNDNNRVSNRFVEDGSYIRLKTLSLAWNVPKRLLSKIKLDWVQVYANVQNLFTITKYEGYDPEIGAQGQSVILQGIDNYRYPSQRIYNFGLKVRF